jgi:hypothetical protein
MMTAANQFTLSADEAALAVRIFTALRAMDDEHRQAFYFSLPAMAERIAADRPRRKPLVLHLVVGGAV